MMIMSEENLMRLQKYIALSEVASRRKAEEMILEGRVKVNGSIEDTLGKKVDVDRDRIEVDGQEIHLKKEKLYMMLNKPSGYVTTVSDQFNRPTVLTIIEKDIKGRVYPVGRLDYDTEGLILLTSDGDFTYTATHPKHKIDKVYLATVKGIPNSNKIRQFMNGLEIEDYVTAPAVLKIVKVMKNSSVLEITIHEGKNRQVRKMCETIGHPVIKLKRVAIGNIRLGNLPLGKWRHLTESEIKYLRGI